MDSDESDLLKSISEAAVKYYSYLFLEKLVPLDVIQQEIATSIRTQCWNKFCSHLREKAKD